MADENFQNASDPLAASETSAPETSEPTACTCGSDASCRQELAERAAKLAACEAQRDEYLAGWQRARADFINYKKEEGQRLEEVARYAGENLIYELISVLDSFDLGLAALERQGTVEKGVYMIRTQIEDALRRRGLERLAVAAGDQFDPALSETVAEVESGSDAGTITEVIEPGYKLHDKVIRPARVKVSKGRG